MNTVHFWAKQKVHIIRALISWILTLLFSFFQTYARDQVRIHAITTRNSEAIDMKSLPESLDLTR